MDAWTLITDPTVVALAVLIAGAIAAVGWHAAMYVQDAQQDRHER